MLSTGNIFAISNPFIFFGDPFLIFWKGLGLGDTQDRFWYNNAMAEGKCAGTEIQSRDNIEARCLTYRTVS